MLSINRDALGVCCVRVSVCVVCVSVPMGGVCCVSACGNVHVQV